MKDLHDIGLRGRLPNFISNFLSDRSFNVRIGSTLSDTFEQEQGVPQGSILSPTLFNIKINNIFKCVNDTDSSLYVDDFGIFYKSKNMENIEFRLSKEKALFILHVMIGMLSSHLMQSEIIIYGLVRKCVKLSPFS